MKNKIISIVTLLILSNYSLASTKEFVEKNNISSSTLCDSKTEKFNHYCKVLPFTKEQCKESNSNYHISKGKEEFVGFVKVFYCALKENSSPRYLSRIKFCDS